MPKSQKGVILKRKIYDELLKWKREKNGRTALMIEGARRIGKSYIVEEFARNEYDSYIMIDFSKAPKLVKSWFDLCLEEVDTLLENIQLRYKEKLTPRKSMIIGGMPQAINAYLETKDFTKVDAVKRQILKLYRNDIHKYADNVENKVTAIYDEIPEQLSKHEKKFRLTALKDEARMRNYEDAFFWLADAKIINCCYNSSEPNVSLRLNEDRCW